MVPIGTVVHYVLPDGPEHVHGRCRPAIVINPLAHAEYVTLVIWRNGPMDGADQPFMEWIPGAEYSPRHAFGTWHRLEECAHPHAEA